MPSLCLFQRFNPFINISNFLMLSFLILLPLFGVLVLSLTSKTNVNFIRNFSLFWAFVVFNASLLLLFSFDLTYGGFQFIERFDWLVLSNNTVILGIDGIALFMIILTTFLIPVCTLLSWGPSVKANVKEYNIAFFALESILIGVFCSLDILFFYILFEAVLIPMFFIVGVYGSRERRVRASYLLFLYTLISSVFMLIAILALYFWVGTTDFQKLRLVEFDPLLAKFCWFAFFLSFGVKMNPVGGTADFLWIKPLKVGSLPLCPLCLSFFKIFFWPFVLQ